MFDPLELISPVKVTLSPFTNVSAFFTSLAKITEETLGVVEISFQFLPSYSLSAIMAILVVIVSITVPSKVNVFPLYI